MDFDDDPMDLLEDDDDGVIEMGLFFDEDGNKQNSQKTPQGTGCAVVLFCMGTGVISGGLLFTKFMS